MLNELQESWCSESTWDFSDLRFIEDVGGIPAPGNQRSASEAGNRFHCPNPDAR